jgi:hypothetical protein
MLALIEKWRAHGQVELIEAARVKGRRHG